MQKKITIKIKLSLRLGLGALLYLLFLIRLYFSSYGKATNIFIHDFLSGETYDQNLVWRKDLSWWRDQESLPKEGRFLWILYRFSYGYAFIENRCLVSSSFAYNNYGHFILDALPKLKVYEADSSWNKSNHSIMLQRDWSNATILIKTLFPHKNIEIYRKAKIAVCVECQLAPVPSSRRMYTEEQESFFSKLSLKLIGDRSRVPTATVNTKIFIERVAQKRNIENSSEVEKLLKRRGFAIVNAKDPYFIQKLRDATVILGVHGADLADIVFARNIETFIELRPRYHPYDYFTSIATRLGARVFILECSVYANINEKIQPNFYVDLEALDEVIKY